MRLNTLKQAALGASLMFAAAAAPASSVSFTNFVDSDHSPLLFDVSGNVIAGNTLTLGLNNFTASASGGSHVTSKDTVAFTVTAPDGFVITSISYRESGVATTNANGIGFADGSFIADGTPEDFSFFITTELTSASWAIVPDPITIAISNKQQISVSVSNFLKAISLTAGGTSDISKTAAEIKVGIAAVPLPPALAMLGAGVLALATVGGRKRA